MIFKTKNPLSELQEAAADLQKLGQEATTAANQLGETLVKFGKGAERLASIIQRLKDLKR